jgi:hypothetical protein
MDGMIISIMRYVMMSYIKDCMIGWMGWKIIDWKYLFMIIYKIIYLIKLTKLI